MSESVPVLHLVHNLDVGGAQRMILHMCAGLRKRGRYRPVVCAWRRGGPMEVALAEAGVPTVVLGLPRRNAVLDPFFLLDAARVLGALRSLARREGVRLIQAHMSDSAVWGVLTARRLGCPSVVTVHSNNLVPFDLLPGSPRRALRLWLLRWATRRADRTVAVSSSVQDAICAETGVPPDRVSVVTNGVPFPARVGIEDRAAQRGRLGVPPEARLLTCVGRLVENKGQASLVAMMSVLREKHPAACLLLVGDGPMREALRSEADRRRLGDAVLLAGERVDVAAALAASDVFVSGSLFEGISLAILEAMAVGVPVVAFAVPGNLEVLADGAGLLVPAGDVGALAGAVDRVLADPTLSGRLGDAGRRRVSERFSIEGVVARVEEVYADLLGGAFHSRQVGAAVATP